MFMHHEDVEVLAKHYGSEEAIPHRLREMYAAAIKFFHGPCAASGPLPGPTLIGLVAACEPQAQVVVVQQQEEETPPPLGDKHSPIFDLPVNTALRLRDGRLGYFIGAWGQDEVRVRLEGDDKPYRRIALSEVELAV